MEEIKIDINCDVGEGVLNEPKLFPFISSCNVACGGHTGDKSSMERTVTLAKENGVKIGAHPSYPDKDNFGRISLKMNTDILSESLISQIYSLAEICDDEGIELKHIKPHGALYNDLAKDSILAESFIETISEFRDKLFLFVPHGSIIQQLALESGFKIMVEAFADRNYNDDLSLVSRSRPNAILEQPDQVLRHMLYMVKDNKVKTVSNHYFPMFADTYCIHGDTSSALKILAYISEELPKYHIVVNK